MTATTTLFRNGSVYCPSDPFATAVMVVGDRIAWIGGEGAAAAHADAADEIVDLDGALLTPAFVDAHLHLTATGLLDLGVNLSAAAHAGDVLDAVSAAVAAGASTVMGFGWDETTWSAPEVPTAAALDRVAGDVPVLLDRIDVHSSLVSSALLDRYPRVRQTAGYDSSAWLRAGAHDLARSSMHADLPEALRREAQHSVLRKAASVGIGTVHEMGGPGLSGWRDLAAALDAERDADLPRVIGYWAEIDGAEAAAGLGATGAAGDLYVDGTVGSHSALLRAPYRDAPGCGDAYLSAAQVRSHVLSANRAGLQAGFHVIGDGALDVVLAGFDEAAEIIGPAAVRSSGHRLEHVELIWPEQIPRLAHHGLIASVQPRFDEEWGGPDGLYSDRLGDRWLRMNPLADLVAGGVALAFGSDAPVTPLDPWATVRAAAHHRHPRQQLTVRAAFAAHTRGGWRAARRHGGVIAVGAPADLALWRVADLVVQTPDERVAAWSTDPRSGTPGLPELRPGVDLPTCLRTVVAGATVYDSGDLGD